MEDINGKNVIVTGGFGFLGQHLVKELESHNPANIYLVRHSGDPSKGADLIDLEMTDTVFCNVFTKGNIDCVFHLAGFNGGIEFNRRYPADIFMFNTMMAMNVLDACRRYRAKKVVSVVASCAYPEWEFAEDDEDYWVRREIMYPDQFLNGPPHASVACHGYAKRNLQLASMFLKEQYGLRAVCVCPTTLYGPGDCFDVLRTKVMGALVKKFVDAVDDGKGEVQLWGSGLAKREFLYADDAAKLLVQTMLHYEDSTQPLNLGTGQEYSVKELAQLIATRVGFSGTIAWDTTKDDGQLRKRLDTFEQERALPKMEFTPIENGIDATVAYYREHKANEARHRHQ